MKKVSIWICSVALIALLVGCGEYGQISGESTGVISVQKEEIAVRESEESEEQTLEEIVPLEQTEALQTEQEPEEIPEKQESNRNENDEEMVMKMNVQIGEEIFTASLLDNEAVDALVEMMKEAPVVIQMSDYAGFEKVGSLGTSLPTSNSQTTTQAGDIVLYQGNQIVIFYGSNSWSYTRLGHIDDLSGWEEALGSGDVTVVLSMEDL